MDAVFLKLLNMSINATWIVLTVLILRLFLKKAPKWISCVLWSFVALRLVLPFSIESIFSMIPSAETVAPDIMYDKTPAINSGISFVNSAVNPIISESFSPSVGDSVNPLQIVVFVAEILWLTGVIAMLLYSAVSYIRLRRRVREAVLCEKNIWQSDHIASPFILGIIRPRIYLPSDMSREDTDIVIAHEEAHLRRHDHLWKPLGFLLLSIYWFNPAIWLAYILLCRDIEFACDEKVIKEKGESIKRTYSETLINCSVSRRSIAACPLAFGEVGIKKRIKNILSYKKPAFWIIIISIILCIATAVCFLTNPKAPVKEYDGDDTVKVLGTDSDRDDVRIDVVELSESSGELKLSVRWLNEHDDVLFYGEDFEISKKNGSEWTLIETDTVWNMVAYSVNPSSVSFSNAHIEYNLSNYCDFTSKGVYRFSTDYFFEKDHSKSYSVSVDFELTEPVTTYDQQADKLVSLIENGLSSLGIEHKIKATTESAVASKAAYVINLQSRTDSIAVYRFNDTETAISEKSKISEDGSYIKQGNNGNDYIYIDFTDPPHWYHNGCVIFCYTGYDSDIMDLLNSICVKQFAGCKYENSKPDVSSLKSKYPDFFGLDDSEGLVVYVWQMSKYSFECAVESAITDPSSDYGFAFAKGTSVNEMKVILSTYTTDKIEIRPVRNYLSSYYYEIDDAYREKVNTLFFG